MVPTFITSTQLLRFLEFLFHTQTQMLSSPNPVFSISMSLASCFLPSLHSCVSHSCTHHLAVFPLALLISLTYALFPDSIYKTLVHVCIQYVLNIDIDFCSHCLLDLVTTLNSGTLISILPEYSSFILTSTLISGGYAQFQINFQTSGCCY